MKWLLLLIAIPAHAEIYTYKDIEGKKWLTNDMNYEKVAISKADIIKVIEQTAKKHKVDPELVKAVVQAESNYNRFAISKTGAVGLMQLMPDTAKRFGVNNRTDVRQNINGGVKYLKYLSTVFKDKRLVVAGYNAGEGAVIRHNNMIPPYQETQEYVVRVMSLLKH
jgi:soluble lytic murein transglycosylase-like protein